MPTLDFKGKNLIWAHHHTVPHRPLVPDPARSVLSVSAPPPPIPARLTAISSFMETTSML